MAVTFVQSENLYRPFAFFYGIIGQLHSLYLLLIRGFVNCCTNFYLRQLVERDIIFNHLHGFIGIPPP